MNKSTQPGRRAVILGGAAIVGAAALPERAQAGLASADDLLAATRKFIATLEPDKLKAASFPWNGSEWRSWNYFGIAGYIKPGLRLEQMIAAQKAAAWDLLAAVWSPNGLQKAKNVMLLQDILAQSGNGTGQRSSERFSISLFGTPAEKGAWGFRFEGHHLTQSIAVRDNRIVSVTPFSFSALPNRVNAGKHAGTQHAQGRGRSGAQAVRAILPRRASARRASAIRRPTTFSPMPGASAPTPRRSALPPLN